MFLYVVLCFLDFVSHTNAATLSFERNKQSVDFVGFFWQITDIHYDGNYSISGVPTNMCHQSTSKLNNGTKLGIYGDFLCDSPWQLVTSAIEGMRANNAEPDFIIWTGDSIPHVNNSELDRTEVFKIIGNVTRKLAEVFPNISIFPVLGNHDPYPANQMPPGSDGYYGGILKNSHWENILDSDQQTQFNNGGYYSSYIQSNLRLLALNTNLYYQLDTLVKDMEDPAGQLAWFEKQLIDCRSKKEKAYVISHVPPGAFERLARMSWFYPQFNQQYLKIIADYSDIIIGQFYGHEHTDSFRLLIDQHDEAINTMFLSPAVTPWKSTLPGVGANNPSIRLYSYIKETGVVIDYKQYYLNLTEANSLHKADWKLEYQATEAFNIPDLSPTSLDRLSESFRDNDYMFNKYLVINTVGYDTNPQCNSTCKRNQICAIRQLNLDRYADCISGRRDTTFRPVLTTHHHHGKPDRKPVPRYMFYIIGSMAGVILLLTILFAVLCFNRGKRRRVPFKYGRFAGPIN
ncbi:hypothetical protein SNE40_004376 [Patella caerulea]|uniref:Acid sphingomyelinase-like phosphodiesterase 3b n=2 Tax=Patella caerulea TaxID=87958 RepID=A0AAN8PY08_PATCE